MNKLQKFLVILIVALALIGFVALSVYVFITTVTTTGEVELNNKIIFISNALSGLIGGIVAVGFGISPPASNTNGENALSRSMIGLGEIAYNGGVSITAENSKSKKVLGFIYSLVYIILGVAAVVIWVVDDMPHEIVKNLSTIFIGMVIPIVAGFFRENR